MIETILLLLSLATLTAVYFMKQRAQRPKRYIWVGDGEDPFKR